MPAIMLPAKVESFPLAIDFLCKQLAGEDASVVQFMELSVEELLVNVAHYAYTTESCADGGMGVGDSAAAVQTTDSTEQNSSHTQQRAAKNWGMIEVGVRNVSMDGVPYVCMWIKDWGRPFDPFSESKKPDTSLDAEERPIGGLGVHLVKNVSAHHCYSGNDGTNTIELYFARPPASC